MNNISSQRTRRILCISIIALILIFTVGIAVSGLDPKEDTSDLAGDGNLPTDGTTGDTINDTSKDNEEDSSLDQPQVPEKIFYNRLTGLPVDETTSLSKPYAFILDPESAAYGLSYSDILIELPLEGGKTRYLMYTTAFDDLDKIGALAPQRSYITNLLLSFGGISFSLGVDDIFDYESLNFKTSVDLSDESKYYFWDNTTEAYTTDKMIEELLKRENQNKSEDSEYDLPFDFTDADKRIECKISAESVLIPYSKDAPTVFKYDDLQKKYVLHKNSTPKKDPLSGKDVSFDNLFVLFADTFTYETSSGTEMITDTISGGKGYYLTNGKLKEISWSTSAGELYFTDLSGEKLVINRGNTYIGFYKSSESSKVEF